MDSSDPPNSDDRPSSPPEDAGEPDNQEPPPTTRTLSAEDAAQFTRNLDDFQPVCDRVRDLMDAGLFAEALDPALLAVHTTAGIFGPNHDQLGIALQNLALCCVMTGQIQPAVTIYETAVPIRETARGADDERAVHCRECLQRTRELLDEREETRASAAEWWSNYRTDFLVRARLVSMIGSWLGKINPAARTMPQFGELKYLYDRVARAVVAHIGPCSSSDEIQTTVQAEVTRWLRVTTEVNETEYDEISRSLWAYVRKVVETGEP